MSEEPRFVAEEVIGWRAWKLKGPTILRPPRLTSVTTRFLGWRTDDWTVAECARCEEIPGENCSCGIYAASTKEHLSELGYGLMGGTIIGEVGLAGKVVVGTQGYRAEKARPVRLFVSYFDWQLVRPLRETFGVPVELMNTDEDEEWR
jgi:hypothetical protein